MADIKIDRTESTQGKVEDEQHFMTECDLYNTSREKFYSSLNKFCSNFRNMNNHSKFLWVFSNEDPSVLNLLGNYILDCFDIRQHHQIHH